MPFKPDVRASLDDVMTTAGLPWNSYESDSDREEYVMYCGVATEYLSRFPHLAGEGWAGHVSCVDVYVRGTAHGILSVEIEGEPLEELLVRSGGTASWNDTGLPLVDQLDRLRRAFIRLYG